MQHRYQISSDYQPKTKPICPHASTQHYEGKSEGLPLDNLFHSEGLNDVGKTKSA
jgi:hypothetical protein